MGDLNRLYKDSPALWAEDFSHRGFEWIEAGDGDHNVLSYLRKGSDADNREDLIVCVVNFAGTPHEGYRVGLPFAGSWDEVLNTDSELYGGSGVGNLGRVEAEELPWNGRPASVRLRPPRLGAPAHPPHGRGLPAPRSGLRRQTAPSKDEQGQAAARG